MKGNGRDYRFSTNLRSWVPYGETVDKVFKQWKSRVCSAHRSVESVSIDENSASLLESFWNLSIFVESLCLGGVFAKSLPKSLWSLTAFRSVCGVSAEFT